MCSASAAYYKQINYSHKILINGPEAECNNVCPQNLIRARASPLVLTF